MRRSIVLLLCAALTLAGDPALKKKIRIAINMLKSQDADERIGGARVVSRIGPPAKAAIPYLVDCLESSDWTLRTESRKAVAAIGVAGVPDLVKGLKKRKDSATRVTIAEILKKFGYDAREEIKSLLPYLADENRRVREAITDTVGSFGPGAVAPLVRTLKSRDPIQRTSASRALARIGRPAVPKLHKVLQSNSAPQRAGAAHSLGLMGSKAQQAADTLLGLVRDEYAEVREQAVFALGRVKGLEAKTLPALVYALGDESRAVRRAAIDAVARFGKAAAPLLILELGGKNHEAAIESLSRLRTAGVGALVEATRSPSAKVRAGAARALGRMDAGVQVDTGDLDALLDDAEPEVRRAAALAIADQGGAARAAAGPLREALGDKDAGVRAAAAFALGEASPREADTIDALNASRTKDPDATVRLAAAGSLWWLGEPAPVLETALPVLRDANASEDSLRAAVRVLGRLGRAAAPAIPDLVAVVEGDRKALHAAAVDALGRIASAHGAGLLGRAERYAQAPQRTREVIDAGLGWLARHQDTKASGVNNADGRWHPVRFAQHHPEGRMTGAGGLLYSVGLSGLALSAFLSVGHTHEKGAFKQNVAEGLDFLIRNQYPDGCLPSRQSQHFQICHAIATTTLCEAWLMTGNARYGRAAQAALNYCCAARNPDLGWRYEPRGGENDTDVTALMLTALRMGAAGGLRVDPDAFRGGGDWIVAMTIEPEGQTGYNMCGGASARPSGLEEKFLPEQTQAMTAAALWSRRMVGPHLVSPKIYAAGVELCEEVYPVWNGGFIDMYYWHFGTLVLYQEPEKSWKAWRTKLHNALFPSQRKGDLREYGGSWDPIGVWGRDGGRLYSTALCAMTLATPFRFERGFAEAKPPAPFSTAAAALERVAESKAFDEELRESAARWLDQIHRR